MRIALLALVIAASPACAASGARATDDAAKHDQAPPPRRLTPQEAKVEEWMQIGNAAFKEGRFSDAEVAYRGAFAIRRGHDTAGNLGMAELAQGKLRDAAQHLALTMRTYPPTADASMRDQLEKAFEAAKKDVGAIRVDVDEEGAIVLVDGVSVGESPLLDDVFVEPGEHLIEAKVEGRKSAHKRVSVKRGESTTVMLGLAPPKSKHG